MRFLLPIFLTLALLLSSCSRRTLPVQAPVPAAVSLSCTPHKTFSVTSGTVTYADNSKKLSASIQVFVDKEKNCYFQASVLFIEACRGLMTADSLFLLNRLERTCLQASVSDLEKSFGIKVTPASLFTLLTGGYCIDELAATCQMTPKVASADHAFLTTADGYQATLNRLPGTDCISDFQIADKKGQTIVTAAYKGYRQVADMAVPAQIICTQTKPQRNVTVQFSQTAFDVQKEVNFVIPASYKRKDLKF